MQELIELLKDGKSRSITMIAADLNMSVEQVERDIEFLERSGVLKRIEFSMCGNCSGCSTGEGPKTCPGCVPDGGFRNMGVMWEIID
ncbi:MAG: DeoR family transcriptional regulator [Clostridiales bacterium]|nr:DeoR family transcriptional regulator [Clostridiales bacterium]MBR6960519.1 DeoR family transcriptional regulator [Clostridiales bacterium]